MPSPSPWTDELDREIARLWNEEGFTDSLIADDLNRAFGTAFTRNSVIGRRARLTKGGVHFVTRRNERDAAVAVARHRKPRQRSEPKPVSLSAAVPPEPVEIRPHVPQNPIDLFSARDCHCRFIVSEDGQFPAMFCGDPAVDGTSWCAGHLPLLTVPPTRRNIARATWAGWRR